MNEPIRRRRCVSCKELRDRAEINWDGICVDCMKQLEDACRSCGRPAGGVQYCAACAKKGAADCVHGKAPGECGPCDHRADMEYDAAREGRC